MTKEDKEVKCYICGKPGQTEDIIGGYRIDVCNLHYNHLVEFINKIPLELRTSYHVLDQRVWLPEVTEEQAEQYLTKRFEIFSQIKTWADNQKEFWEKTKNILSKL